MTPVELDPLADDPLAQRLSALVITTPAPVRAVRATTRVAPPSLRVRQRRRAAIGVALLTAVAGGNGVAAYWMPTWAHALAAAPVLGALAGPVLRDAGLTTSDVTVMNDSGTAHGITVSLLGGDADGVRTTLFVNAPQVRQGPAADGNPVVVVGDLVDQFGRHYAQRPNGHAVGQLTTLDFEPLSGAAATVGARFAVTFSIRDNVKTAQHTLGTVVLHGTLLPRSAREISPPPVLADAGTYYQVTEVRVSSSRIEVRTRTWGARQDAQTRAALAPLQNQAFLADPANLPAEGVLVGPDGQRVREISGMGSSGPELPSVLVSDSIYAFAGPGTYRWELVQATASGPGRVIGQKVLAIP